MGFFNSTSWTGGDVADAVTLPKPSVKSTKIAPKAVHPTRDGFLAEYSKLAEIVGISSPDSGIESFKDFLRAQDWGIFSLNEVVLYMDNKAAKESKDGAGWEWRPLRDKDQVLSAKFGGPAQRSHDTFGHRAGPVDIPASDYYEGPQKVTYQDNSGYNNKRLISASQSAYDKIIPLHALRKIAAIERDFKAVPVAFFVCDYALAPQIEHPDPFLMAVINNPNLRIGVGRFIIDFWDEPGFGLDRMLDK